MNAEQAAIVDDAVYFLSNLMAFLGEFQGVISYNCEHYILA